MSARRSWLAFLAAVALSGCAPSQAARDGWEGGGIVEIEGYWTTGALDCSDGCPVELADARQILAKDGSTASVVRVIVASLPWARTDGHGTIISSRAGLGDPVLVVAQLDDGTSRAIGMYCQGPSFNGDTGELTEARRCQPQDIGAYRVGAGIPTS